MTDNRPIGTVFPPRSVEEVEAYDKSEMMDAWLEFERGDPAPGDNRSAAYRWAWNNRNADATGDHGDGLYPMRRAVARRYMERQRGAA